MLYVNSRIDIGQPVDRVFRYVVDVATHRDWQEDLVDAYVTPASPVQVGSVYHYTSEVMGRRTHSAMQVTKFDENWRFMLSTSTILNRVETAFHFEAINGTTRLMVTTKLEGGLIRRRVRWLNDTCETCSKRVCSASNTCLKRAASDPPSAAAGPCTG